MQQKKAELWDEFRILNLYLEILTFSQNSEFISHRIEIKRCYPYLLFYSIVETGLCSYCINKQICKYKSMSDSSSYKVIFFCFRRLKYASWVLWINSIFKCRFWSSSLLALRWALIKLGSLCSRNMKTVFRSVLHGVSFCLKLPKNWLKFGKLWRKNKWRTNHYFAKQMGRFHHQLLFFCFFSVYKQKTKKNERVDEQDVYLLYYGLNWPKIKNICGHFKL